MYERKIEIDYNSCGIKITMDIIGGKWKPCLINAIHNGYKRPSELLRQMPYASKRALNIQLNELENHGVIAKTIFPVLPPKVEYHLTQFGESLLPITKAMEQWGNENKDHCISMFGVSDSAEKL